MLERPFFQIDAFAFPTLFAWHTGMSRIYTLDKNTYSNGFAFLYLNCRSYEVAPARSSSELEASVDKLFDEGVKTKVVDDGEPSHPTMKLKDDHGAPSGPTVGEGEGEDHTKLLAEANLRTIGALQRFVISSDSSNHSGVNIMKDEVDSVVKTFVPTITSATTTTPIADPATISKEKFIGSSVFGADSPSVGESHPIPGGFSNCTGSDFLIGGIHTVIDPDSNLQKVYVPQWNVTNGSCLTMVVSVISLSVKVRMRADYNIRERRLNSVIEEKDALIKHKDEEIRNLKAQLSEVAALKERNNLMEIEKSGLDVKVANLAASVKVREQEVAELDDVVTSIKLQNDNFVDQVHKLEAYSTGLQEKIMAASIGKSIEKGIQDGVSAGITHGVEGRVLTDVTTYNPSMKADYLSALIKENIAKHRSALRDVFVPLSKPLSVTALTGTKSTLNVIPATVDTTTALSINFVSASLIPPISTDDYEITYAEGEKSVGADASPFPDVDDAKLKIP
nr:hypothetical protein [Tanacetum cinerariifolium]